MKKAFIEVIDPDKATGSLAKAYRRIGGKRGNIANVHQVQSLHPKAMMAHLDLYMAIMYEDSPLSRVQREIIGSVVSYFNQCDYCVVHHHEALLANWDEAPAPKALAQGQGLSDPHKLMIQFCEKLTRKPYEITSEDYKELRSVGFDDRSILDITLIVGYFNFVNRLVLGVGVELESQEQREYKY